VREGSIPSYDDFFGKDIIVATRKTKDVTIGNDFDEDEIISIPETVTMVEKIDFGADNMFSFGNFSAPTLDSSMSNYEINDDLGFQSERGVGDGQTGKTNRRKSRRKARRASMSHLDGVLQRQETIDTPVDATSNFSEEYVKSTTKKAGTTNKTSFASVIDSVDGSGIFPISERSSSVKRGKNRRKKANDESVGLLEGTDKVSIHVTEKNLGYEYEDPLLGTKKNKKGKRSSKTSNVGESTRTGRKLRNCSLSLLETVVVTGLNTTESKSTSSGNKKHGTSMNGSSPPFDWESHRESSERNLNLINVKSPRKKPKEERSLGGDKSIGSLKRNKRSKRFSKNNPTHDTQRVGVGVVDSVARIPRRASLSHLKSTTEMDISRDFVVLASKDRATQDYFPSSEGMSFSDRGKVSRYTGRHKATSFSERSVRSSDGADDAFANPFSEERRMINLMCGQDGITKKRISGGKEDKEGIFFVHSMDQISSAVKKDQLNNEIDESMSLLGHKKNAKSKTFLKLPNLENSKSALGSLGNWGNDDGEDGFHLRGNAKGAQKNHPQTQTRNKQRNKAPQLRKNPFRRLSSEQIIGSEHKSSSNQLDFMKGECKDIPSAHNDDDSDDDDFSVYDFSVCALEDHQEDKEVSTNSSMHTYLEDDREEEQQRTGNSQVEINDFRRTDNRRRRNSLMHVDLIPDVNEPHVGHDVDRFEANFDDSSATFTSESNGDAFLHNDEVDKTSALDIKRVPMETASERGTRGQYRGLSRLVLGRRFFGDSKKALMNPFKLLGRKKENKPSVKGRAVRRSSFGGIGFST